MKTQHQLDAENGKHFTLLGTPDGINIFFDYLEVCNA